MAVRVSDSEWFYVAVDLQYGEVIPRILHHNRQRKITAFDCFVVRKTDSKITHEVAFDDVKVGHEEVRCSDEP